jgi:hypothetical protein
MRPNFRCRHALAGLWSLPDPKRLEVFREVIPLASDLVTQQLSLEKELTTQELAIFWEAISSLQQNRLNDPPIN